MGIALFICSWLTVAALAKEPLSPWAQEVVTETAKASETLQRVLAERGADRPWQSESKARPDFLFSSALDFVQSLTECLRALPEHQARLNKEITLSRGELESDVPDPAKISQYIGGPNSGLGSKSFKERQKSEARLILLLKEAKDRLREAARSNQAPEVRARAAGLVAQSPPEYLRLCLKDSAFQFYGPILQALYPQTNSKLCEE